MSFHSTSLHQIKSFILHALKAVSYSYENFKAKVIEKCLKYQASDEHFYSILREYEKV